MNDLIKKVKEKYLISREKSIVRNFYSKEAYKGKSYRAISMDNIFIVLMLFLVLAFFLIIKTNSIILPIYISLIAAFFITRSFNGLKSKKSKEKVLKINEELKSKRIIRELGQLNRTEFIEYIKAILEKFYLSEFKYGEDGVDLVGIVNDKKYAVKCIKSSFEDKIIMKRLTEFNSYIDYLDYDEGIIITNSYFQDGLKEETSLILFDFMGIKEILRSINEYPTDEEITNYIIHRFNDRKNNVRNQIKLITVKKIIKLYGVFIIFFLISYFVKYSLYYRIMGVLSFVIATVMGGIKITENSKVKGKYTLLK